MEWVAGRQLDVWSQIYDPRCQFDHQMKTWEDEIINITKDNTGI